VLLDDPAPLPPDLPPFGDEAVEEPDLPPFGDEAAEEPDLPIAPPVPDMTDMEPAPVPQQTLEGDGAADGMELAPAPPDDPAPVPELEIPRNQLPKSKPAAPAVLDTTRATSGRAVKVHLSDFIRTRE